MQEVILPTQEIGSIVLNNLQDFDRPKGLNGSDSHSVHLMRSMMDFEKQNSTQKRVSRRVFSTESSRHRMRGSLPLMNSQHGVWRDPSKIEKQTYSILGYAISSFPLIFILTFLQVDAFGTGLFVGSGQVLSLVGPAPLLMSYRCIGMVMSSIIWVVMNSLGEMTTYMPLGGVSVPYFVKRYCEPLSQQVSDGLPFVETGRLFSQDGTTGKTTLSGFQIR
jgi:hypothetical protein